MTNDQISEMNRRSAEAEERSKALHAHDYCSQASGRGCKSCRESWGKSERRRSYGNPFFYGQTNSGEILSAIEAENISQAR